MTTEGQVQDLLDRVAALQGTVVRERLADELIKRPDLGDALVKQMTELLDAVVIADNAQPVPPDKGLAQLVGVGPEAASELRADPAATRRRAVRRGCRFRTHRRRRRPVLHLPAREARSVPRNSEAAAAVPCRHHPAVVRQGVPTRSTSSTAEKCFATPARTGSRRTARPLASAWARPDRVACEYRLRSLFTHFNNEVALVLAR